MEEKTPDHCEGCDQSQASTRPRNVRVRATGARFSVRYCDDCTADINSGTHDTYDVAEDFIYPDPPGDSNPDAGRRTVDRARQEYSTDQERESK